MCYADKIIKLYIAILSYAFIKTIIVCRRRGATPTLTHTSTTFMLFNKTQNVGHLLPSERVCKINCVTEEFI